MVKLKHSNRLLKETSPYLNQHGHNPVDWYPWGKDALGKSKRENKPIFLSIGYSACHWCHVMEKESFEDEETAKLMNTHFINIKVDREERQDLDSIYMSAVQIMTQHGGWPMSVFLTPELKPFYGGTYFPPDDRMGLPSFKKVLLGVSNTWKTRKEEVLQSADTLVSALKEMSASDNSEGKVLPSLSTIKEAVLKIKENYDPTYGGIGRAPKFFHTMDFRVCLRHWKTTKDEEVLSMVIHTLNQWASGGIYDQLGGGFHRYSTDQVWLVPHFEKMLYDNALLTQLYLEAYQATHKMEFSQIAHQTLDFTLREMTSPEGGFYSTQDADSEGIEGKFYVWNKKEILLTLGQDLGDIFIKVFNVTEEGNWEGENILHRTKPYETIALELGIDALSLEESLSVAKRKLLALRSKRIAPFRDEKILVSWNGMMIEALASGYQILSDKRYLEAAQKAAHFILTRMKNESSELYHSFKDEQAIHGAYLDDYACFIQSLLILYESDFNYTWIEEAEKLTKTLLEQFWDESEKDFYFTAKNHETLILRPKEKQDGATPSATAMAITALSHLGRLTGKAQYLAVAEQALTTHEKLIRVAPMATAQMLVALDFLLSNPMEIVIAPGESEEEKEAFLQIVRDTFLPSKICLVLDEKYTNPHFTGRFSQNNKTTAYVCQGFSCQNPTTNSDELKTFLER